MTTTIQAVYSGQWGPGNLNREPGVGGVPSGLKKITKNRRKKIATIGLLGSAIKSSLSYSKFNILK